MYSSQEKKYIISPDIQSWCVPVVRATGGIRMQGTGSVETSRGFPIKKYTQLVVITTSTLCCFGYLDRIEGWLRAVSDVWVQRLLLLAVRWQKWRELTGPVGKELRIEGSHQLWIPVQQQLRRLQHQLR